MRRPPAQFTVRQTMILVAFVAFGLFVVYRDAPIFGSARYHANEETYWRNLADQHARLASTGRLRKEDTWYDGPIQDRLVYHAHWRRVLTRSMFRFWERSPAISLDFPPRRSLAPPP
jgi:hypothetical protein